MLTAVIERDLGVADRKMDVLAIIVVAPFSSTKFFFPSCFSAFIFWLILVFFFLSRAEIGRQRKGSSADLSQ
jgi:hypothetical protein